MAPSPQVNLTRPKSAGFPRLQLFASFLAAVLLLAQPPVFAQSVDVNTYRRLVGEGTARLQQGDHRAARDSFEEALRYLDGDAAAHLGLGIASFHLKDDRTAERELLRAIELQPREKTAYLVLGDLAYRRDDLGAAMSIWEKAVEIDPSDGALKGRLERIRKEHRTEKDFSRDVTSHFSIKYEGREKIEAGRIVLRILEDAYGDVGRALSYYPEQEVAVILYSNQQFQEVTDAPGWSGGIYDGKIRLPIGGIEQETPGLRRLLVHEYTHAVVRAITRRVPTWLNEGLAQYFEGREIDSRQKDLLRRLAQSEKLPSLRDLEGSFLGLSGRDASLAYVLSLSATAYLVDRHGMYRVKMILEDLATGGDTARAIDRVLLMPYEDFERGWMRSLQ